MKNSLYTIILGLLAYSPFVKAEQSSDTLKEIALAAVKKTDRVTKLLKESSEQFNFSAVLLKCGNDSIHRIVIVNMNKTSDQQPFVVATVQINPKNEVLSITFINNNPSPPSKPLHLLHSTGGFSSLKPWGPYYCQ